MESPEKLIEEEYFDASGRAEEIDFKLKLEPSKQKYANKSTNTDIDMKKMDEQKFIEKCAKLLLLKYKKMNHVKEKYSFCFLHFTSALQWHKNIIKNKLEL